MEENDRSRILQMLKDGKITVEEADQLLGALDSQPAEKVAVKDARGRKHSKLKVLVDAEGDHKNGNAKVNVNIPLSLVRTVGPIVAKNMPREAKEKLDQQGINLEQIFNDVETMIDNGLEEDIVNIDVGDEGNKAKVRIYVE